VSAVTIKQVFVVGPEVATIYDLHTIANGAPMLTVNWAHVVDGRSPASAPSSTPDDGLIPESRGRRFA
jgi:hypothetical protein